MPTASVGMAPGTAPGFAMDTPNPATVNSRTRPLIPLRTIGILGGIASGKSLVTAIFAEHGFGVLNADRAGHETLRLPHVIAAARKRWGEEIVTPDGQIDRGRVAKIVFAPGEAARKEREFLEHLTHPEIGRLLLEEANHMAAAGVPAIVLDAAVMFEAGWNEWCEKLVFIEAPRTIRLARALSRGWKEEDFIAREAAQESLDFKRDQADVVIDNSGTPAHTRWQIERCLPNLLK
jgi:dephospho-CoA kinase